MYRKQNTPFSTFPFVAPPHRRALDRSRIHGDTLERARKALPPPWQSSSRPFSVCLPLFVTSMYARSSRYGNRSSVGMCVGVYLGFRHISVCYVMIWNTRILASNVRNIRACGVCVCAYMYDRHNLTHLCSASSSASSSILHSSWPHHAECYQAIQLALRPLDLSGHGLSVPSASKLSLIHI